jgi:hypothetical protein
MNWTLNPRATQIGGDVGRTLELLRIINSLNILVMSEI